MNIPLPPRYHVAAFEAGRALAVLQRQRRMYVVGITSNGMAGMIDHQVHPDDDPDDFADFLDACGRVAENMLTSRCDLLPCIRPDAIEFAVAYCQSIHAVANELHRCGRLTEKEIRVVLDASGIGL